MTLLDLGISLMLRSNLLLFITFVVICSCASFQHTDLSRIPVQKIEFSKDISIQNSQYLKRLFVVSPTSENILQISIQDKPKNFSYSSNSVKPNQAYIKIEASVILKNRENEVLKSFNVMSQRSIPISQFNPVANTQLERDYEDLMHREILDKIYLNLVSK